MIPRRYVDGFTKALNAVSEDMRRRLADELAAIDMTRPVAEVRQQVVDIMQAYCGGASDMAAVLAAEFYDGLRSYELGEPMGALAVSGRKPEATEGAVRAFAQKLVDGKPDEFRELCIERLDYEVKTAAERAVLINGARDRRRPRFARVSTGNETCDLCLMLASCGFVYRSADSATHTHANCDCRVTPSWNANEVEGYDPKAIYDRWQGQVDQMARERADRKGTSFEDELQAIMDRYRRASENARQRMRGR